MEKKTEPLIKLKPCPFCGGLAILIKVEKNIFTPIGVNLRERKRK